MYTIPVYHKPSLQQSVACRGLKNRVKQGYVHQK